jgi:hypothetical protein
MTCEPKKVNKIERDYIFFVSDVEIPIRGYKPYGQWEKKAVSGVSVGFLRCVQCPSSNTEHISIL